MLCVHRPFWILLAFWLSEFCVGPVSLKLHQCIARDGQDAGGSLGSELERHGTTDVAWDDLGRIGMWGGSKSERVRTSPRSAMRATMRAAPTRKCQTLRCGWLFDTFSYQTCKIRHDLSLDMRTLGIFGGNLWARERMLQPLRGLELQVTRSSYMELHHS